MSLSHEEALVRYDPERINPDRIGQTLRDLGYTVRDPAKVRTFEEEEAELRRERNRLLVAAAFSATTFLLMLFGMWPGLIQVPLMPWVMLTLALETMFITGWYIKRMAWASLRRGILNQHVLLEFGAFAGLVGGPPRPVRQRCLSGLRLLRGGDLHHHVPPPLWLRLAAGPHPLGPGGLPSPRPQARYRPSRPRKRARGGDRRSRETSWHSSDTTMARPGARRCALPHASAMRSVCPLTAHQPTEAESWLASRSIRPGPVDA